MHLASPDPGEHNLSDGLDIAANERQQGSAVSPLGDFHAKELDESSEEIDGEASGYTGPRFGPVLPSRLGDFYAPEQRRRGCPMLPRRLFFVAT